MAERIKTNRKDVSEFLERVGYPIPQEDIIEVFPGYFPDRRVLRVKNGGLIEPSRVLKIRPDDEKAQREVANLGQLLASYRFYGADFKYLNTRHILDSGYLVIDMPYLGMSLARLGTELDLVELGQLSPDDALFTGFTRERIGSLVRGLGNAHERFTGNYGLVHGDLFQGKAPNNLVFHPQLERLLLVDAEALVEVEDENIERFRRQLSQTEEWIYENLLIK